MLRNFVKQINKLGLGKIYGVKNGFKIVPFAPEKQELYIHFDEISKIFPNV